MHKREKRYGHCCLLTTGSETLATTGRPFICLGCTSTPTRLISRRTFHPIPCVKIMPRSMHIKNHCNIFFRGLYLKEVCCKECHALSTFRTLVATCLGIRIYKLPSEKNAALPARLELLQHHFQESVSIGGLLQWNHALCTLRTFATIISGSEYICSRLQG